jgi:transposase-like protein
MNPLQSAEIRCPSCDSPMVLLVDCSVMHQQFIENCEVCCKPFVVETSIADEDYASVRVGREDGSAHLFSHTSA